MAERRMFAKAIIDSDAFIDMPISARLLYYDLAMRADDDGFVNSPKKIMRMIGATNDDMNILLMRRFVIAFESGVVVIKHWRIHNYIQKDRYKPTKYEEERAKLTVKENGAYTLDTPCIQSVSTSDTQVRIGKDRLGKSKSRVNKFTPPTLEQIKAYAKENGLNVDCEKFYTYFTTPDDAGRTWIDSKGNPVKNWKQKLITWAGRDRTGSRNTTKQNAHTFLNYAEKPYNEEECKKTNEELERMLKEDFL